MVLIHLFYNKIKRELGVKILSLGNFPLYNERYLRIYFLVNDAVSGSVT